MNRNPSSSPVLEGERNAAGAASSPKQSASRTVTKQPLQDPTKKFPKPPFPKQSQTWPGLASKMEPRPDHGEKSYRGSGRLQGRKALVTGGDSGMGRAAAIAFAREGADVAINYLPDEEPDAREVIELIEAEGRVGSGDPRRSARRGLLQTDGRRGGQGASADWTS